MSIVIFQVNNDIGDSVENVVRHGLHEFEHASKTFDENNADHDKANKQMRNSLHSSGGITQLNSRLRNNGATARFVVPKRCFMNIEQTRKGFFKKTIDSCKERAFIWSGIVPKQKFIVAKCSKAFETFDEITPDEFFEFCKSIVLEYYEHGATGEVAIKLDEVITSELRPYVTCMLFDIALDHKDSKRKMTSMLLSDLYGHVLTGKDIEKGFEMSLDYLPELYVDVPDAATALGKFMARAVADDCLPPKFLVKAAENSSLSEHGKVAIRRANTLLHIKLGWPYLDNMWGFGGPLCSVKTIKQQMALLLQEYLSSHDIKEAHHCLYNLEVPHFHHELVYKIVLMALEANSQAVEKVMCQLLHSLDSVCLVLPGSLETGFLRVFKDMTDIVLDVPLAYTILERFLKCCESAGFITATILDNIPTPANDCFKPNPI